MPAPSRSDDVDVSALSTLPVSPQSDDDASSTPFDRAKLAEIVELALWAGQLLMENGAETQRVEQSVRSVGTGLGCGWGNVLVTPGGIIVTYVGGSDFRTKVRSVRAGGVNMTLIEELSHLCHRIELGALDCGEVRRELTRIEKRPRHYGQLQTALAAGLGCAAFCRLFGGDWPALLITFVASGCAMMVRLVYIHRGHNPLVVTSLVAFVAVTLSGVAQRALSLSHKPEAALAASVLMLVPGVPTINAIEDLIKGHVAVGLSRAAWALLIILAATLGILAGIRLLALLP